MRKRLLSALLAFCLVLTLLPVTALAAEETPERGWFGDQLMSNEWLIYDALAAEENRTKLQNGEAISITGFAGTSDEVSDAVRNAVAAFGRDHCEIFWTDSVQISIRSINNAVTGVEVTLPLAEPWAAGGRNAAEDYQTVLHEVESRAAAANVTGTDAEKVTAIHNWLVENNAYGDPNASDHTPWTPLSALVDDLSPVCEGYARAFKMICNAAGIDCVLVSGQGTNSSGQKEAHMWNYVEIDGRWYAVDVTWDDPVGAPEGYISDNYLLVGSATSCSSGPSSELFSTTHIADTHFMKNEDGSWNREFAYPELSALSFNAVMEDQKNELGTVTPPETAEDSITYGQPLSAFTLTNGNVKNMNGKDVAGTWAWKNPDDVLPAGSETAAAVFTADAPLTIRAEADVSITIREKSLEGAAEVTVEEAGPFDGREKEPNVTVVVDGKTLTKDLDYTAVYTNNTNAGTASVTVSGIGSYSGTVAGTFEIAKAAAQTFPLSEKTVTPNTTRLALTDLADSVPAGTVLTGVSVTGSVFAAPPEINGNELTFTVAGSADETAEITITGSNPNYESITVTFTVRVMDKTPQPALTISSSSETAAVQDSVILTATGGADIHTDIHWTVSPSTAAELSSAVGNTVTLTPTAAGDLTVTAVKDGNEDYAEVSSNPLTIRVSLSVAALEITSGSAVRYGEKLPLTANMSGVTFTIVDGGEYAEIDENNNLIPRGVGEVTIRAAKAADGEAEYAPAEKTIAILPGVPADEDIPVRPSDTSMVLITNSNVNDYTITIIQRNVTYADLFETLFSGKGRLYLGGDRVDNSDEVIARNDRHELTWYPYYDADTNIWLDVTIEPEADDGETYYIFVPSTGSGQIIPSTRHAARADRVTLSVHPDSGYELDSLVVTDVRGREISTRSSGDGVYSFSMPASRVTVEAEFKKVQESTPDSLPADGDIYNQPFTGLGTPGISGIVLNPAPMPFTDVRSNDWFYNNVEYMWKHYLMSGTSDTRFDPNLTTSRGMIWTILARMNNVRTDINPGSTWYERGQLWAMQQGVTDGTNPMQEVTREQLVTMLWRNAGSPGYGAADLSQFSDAASVSAYAQSAVRWAVGMGVLTGSNGQLNPQGTATRAQVAAMVARYGDKAA